MSSIALVGGTVITPLEMRFSNLIIIDGKIATIGDFGQDELPKESILDVSNCYVTPGLIDLQVNGGPRCNLWGDPTPSQIDNLSEDLLKAGVTCFLPTLITDDLDHLLKNIKFLKSVGVGSLDGTKKIKARMPGIHLEGPCLSPQKPGVHPKEFIQPLNMAVLQKLTDAAVKLMTLAPEGDPSGGTLDYLKEHNVAVSLGHSNATMEEASNAFDRGVRLVTHIFNALPPIHHRAPGAVTAALLDERVTCCLICDGKHLTPAAVKLVLKLKGVGKSILVTDAAQIGTTNGELVGSSILLNEAVTNIVKWQVVSFMEAIKMATINPARAIGVDKEVGSLEVGKYGDVVVWDKDSLTIKHVIVNGELVF